MPKTFKHFDSHSKGGNMSQRSPGSRRGDSHGEPAEDSAPIQNPPKSATNPSIHHPIESTITSQYQIYKELEGFREKKCSTSKCSWAAEVPGDAATTPNFLRREKSTRMGAKVPPSAGCGWRAPSLAGAADRARDSRKLQSTQVNPVYSFPKSYAQVVDSTRYTALRRTDTSLGAPPPAGRSSFVANRRRSVEFMDSPNVAVFLKGSVPADIFLLGRPAPTSTTRTTKLKLRSCLKSPLAIAQKAFAGSSVSGNLSTVSSPVVATPRSQHGNHLPVTAVSQEQSAKISWQIVRGKYWWRKGKPMSSYSSPTTQQPCSTIFKLKTRGRCFNCLTKGHQVASCRDPPKCWRCRGSGHISYQCSGKASKTKHQGNETWSLSDAIHIIPQDHSMTTQELNAWLGMVDRSRKTTSLSQLERKGYDGTTISSSPEIDSPRLEKINLDSANIPIEMSAWKQLWKNRHVDSSASKTKAVAAIGKRTTKIREQFLRETIPYSDAVHIIPLASFSEEQQKNSKESRTCNIMQQHANMEQLDDVVVSSITLPQQSRMLDELHTGKLNERLLTPTESVTKSSNAQKLVTQDTSTIEKESSEPELVTVSNFASMLKKFKEAVTKPLEPCLLLTPNSKSVGEKEVKEEEKYNTEHKIKFKKQKMTTKMAGEFLAMASDELTMQDCKKLTLVVERKRKKKKKTKTSVVVKIAKRKKSNKVD